jgi:YihY family inner membrane protein
VSVWALLHAFDRFQQRHTALAFPIGVLKKFADDQAGSMAAVLAYYGFFSIFPLLLLLVTALGFVLQGNTHLQDQIVNSVVGKIPVVGRDIKVHSLQGHAAAIVVGVLGALWAGTGITQASQNAFNQVWAVPRRDRPDFITSRLRGVRALVVLGMLNIVATGLSGAVGAAASGLVAWLAGLLIALLIDLLLFFAAFRLLTSRDHVPTRCLLPGVALGAVAWLGLQLLGGYYVNHVVRNASESYGVFAIVLGLLAWLHLGAQMTLYAAEVNVVLVRRLWPRSLWGPLGHADRRTLKALAEVEERHDHENVHVTFGRRRRRDGGEE